MANFSHLKNILLIFFSSGKFDKNMQLDDKFRYVIFNLFFLVGGLYFLVYGVNIVLGGWKIRSILDSFFLVICILGIICLRTRIKFFYIAITSISAFAAVCVWFIFSGDTSGFSSLWIYVVPPLSIFILGLNTGIIISSGLLFCIILVFFVPQIPSYNWPPNVAFLIIGAYILELSLNITYEIIRISKDKKEKKLQSTLKRKNVEISAMKDNLKNGIFLMDKDCIIQDNYSVKTEKILGYNKLAGEKFTNFLTASITALEMEILTDYFEMVRTKKFENDMLEDINPIKTFQYINPNNNNESTLQTSFVSIEKGDFVMGNILDITEETLIQQKLKIEEEKSQSEMRSLFEVFQIEKTVFSDFIEDTEYEFYKINSLLKDKNVTSIEILSEIFQSIHAIKANSIILDLKTFSNKAHELETTIKELSGKGEVTINDMQNLTANIDALIRDKDKFVETSAKIQSFANSQIKKNSTEVLLDSLNRTCERTQADTGKNVKFVVREIEHGVLELCPRRVVKEALLQLLRNSVVHGIETPIKRNEIGKNTIGTIMLEIKKINNLIHIRLQDDGQGISIERIKKRAIEMHIVSKEQADTVDNSKILHAIFAPGFSTAEKKTIHAGRGVGLALVRERIKEIGGTIKVQTELGKGTAFNIFIPISENIKKE